MSTCQNINKFFLPNLESLKLDPSQGLKHEKTILLESFAASTASLKINVKNGQRKLQIPNLTCLMGELDLTSCLPPTATNFDAVAQPAPPSEYNDTPEKETCYAHQRRKNLSQIPNLQNFLSSSSPPSEEGLSSSPTQPIDITKPTMAEPIVPSSSSPFSVISEYRLSPSSPQQQFSSPFIQLTECIKKAQSKENQPQAFFTLTCTEVMDAFDHLNLEALSNPYELNLDREMEEEELLVNSQDLEESSLEEAEKKWVDSQILAKRRRVKFERLAPTLKDVIANCFTNFNPATQTLEEIEHKKQMKKLEKGYKTDDDKFFLKKERIISKCRQVEQYCDRPHYTPITRFTFSGPSRKRKSLT